MLLDQDRVPVTFEEALSLISAGLSPQEKESRSAMTAARFFDLHFALAKQLKHEWSLDDPATPLRIFFRELGLDDANEVSLLLLDAYWRAHDNEAIPLQDLVGEYLSDS